MNIKIDSFICREVIREFSKKTPFTHQVRDIVTTHDCFYIHPNDCDTVSTIYSIVLDRIQNNYYGNIIESIFHQIEGHREFIDPYKDKTNIENVELSEHILC